MSLLHAPMPTTARWREAPVRGPVAARTSSALAAVASVAAVLTWVPGLLHGPAAMNGSARGTALVVLVAGVPVLLAGMLLTRRDGWVGPPLWLGALGLMAYNAVLFCFATPFNRAFPVYVAMLGLAVASTVSLLHGLRTSVVETWFPPNARARRAAPYIWLVGGLNTAVWLAAVVPAVVRDDPRFLAGTGLTTNPVYVQDLAFWLPLAALVGWLLWQGYAWGGLLAGGLLVFWVLEAATVAVDQGLAHAADPASPVAGPGGVALFALLGAVGLVVLGAYLRALKPR
jgi:hypothetical protein